MNKTRTVKFLLNEEEYLKIKEISRSKGFKTLSSYLRYIAFNRPIEIEDMIIRIHNKVVNNG